MIQYEKYQEIFNMIDINKDGLLNVDENKILMMMKFCF
jgi:Ca2+-binding EF-hand superfamily protein